MIRKVNLPGGHFPTREELFMQELSQQFAQLVTLGETFAQKFTPNENQRAVFDLIDTSQVPEGAWIHVLLYGGAGSGKTSCALAYQLNLLLKYATARALCIRRTSRDLKDTIYKDVIKFLNDFGINFDKNDNNTSIRLENDSEFIMRSDKSLTPGKTNTSRALGGTMFTTALVEEADTVSIETVSAIPHRLRQNVGSEAFRRVIFYTCNPPSKGHWIHDLFFKKHNPDDPASTHRAIHCDIRHNRKYLPVGYIEGVHEEYKDDEGMLARFFDGQFAPDTRGDVMFKQSFNRKIHVAPSPFTADWNKSYPMQRGWDFGHRGNSMVICQDDPDRQQIRVYAAELERFVMFDDFSNRKISWCYRMFPGAIWEDYADPSGNQQTAMGLSYHDILKSQGINPRSTKEDVAYGITLIAQRLRQLVPGGKPEVLLNAEYCQYLIEAFTAGYCNDKDCLVDEFRPVKDGTYDHVMDAFRYIMIHLRTMGEEIQNRWRNQQDQQRYGNYSLTSGPQGRPVGQRQVYNFGKSRFS